MILAAMSVAFGQAPPLSRMAVSMSWGHTSPQTKPFYIKLNPAHGVQILDVQGKSLEPGEGLRDGAWQTRAGGGDVDGIDFTLAYPEKPPERIQDLDTMWAYLIGQSDPDTARRLAQDAAFSVDPPRFTVQLNPQGTRGFTVTVEQLRRNRNLWLSSLDVYLAAGPDPVAFSDHRKELAKWKGQRILETIASGPESTYQEYASLWEDTGDPNYEHPHLPEPGHIVGLTWDSAIPKFGIDRRAGVWNDYGNPDRFRFGFSLGGIGEGLKAFWKSQRLTDGLPVVVTDFEKEGLKYRVEQFAYPLNGPPPERRGDISMVLLQKVTVTNPAAAPHSVAISLTHERHLPPYLENKVIAEVRNGATVFEDAGFHRALFSIQGVEQDVAWSCVKEDRDEEQKVVATVLLDLPPNGAREFVVKLPSPVVEPHDLDTLLSMDYESARSQTLKFWSDYIAQGAQFQVPEQVVNDLFRASLWHALTLPRRHGAGGDNIQIDLPYSNFAYQQTGTPWPINQAVYVDYMLYGLRGYRSLAIEELQAMYRNNQEVDGRVNGNANWGAYTPGMLYAVAKSYRLSHDQAALKQLLPGTLKALDWCLNQVRQGNQREGSSQGLFDAPLNDLTGDGVWAFNQAYMYAGLETFGQVLEEIGNPRAKEALDAAREIHTAIDRGFGHASMLSPVVQLRDHTWSPYVPSEALTPRRILEQWYPADVDTGAVHLLSLQALPADGDLATALLSDQEDNLYYKGWGMTDEPVYNQQASAYLLRDEPQAVIRDFYSMMACAFSHTVLEPLEHRWEHGEYFGPPSTDGSWFDLYRHMLIDERGDGTLFLAGATPRQWLRDGEKITIERAPTDFGNLSFSLQSAAASGRIVGTIQMPDRSQPSALLVRFRHPQAKRIKSVVVNGQNWTGFDVAKEWVEIKHPDQTNYTIEVAY